MEGLEMPAHESAIAPTRVEVARDGVHVPRTGSRDFGVIEGLVTVAQVKRPRIVFADEVAHQLVVAFGQETQKLAHDSNTVPARLQEEHATAGKLPPAISFLRVKVLTKFFPVVLISLAQELDESSSLFTRRGLFQRHLPQGGIPPAEFVVAVVAQQMRVIPDGQDLLARDVFHTPDVPGIPHVPPGRARSRSNMQNRGEPRSEERRVGKE